MTETKHSTMPATDRIRFGTSIVNIYTRHPADYARSAAAIHELSGGRFVFGIGVSHGNPLRAFEELFAAFA